MNKLTYLLASSLVLLSTACSEDKTIYDTAASAGISVAQDEYEVGEPIQFTDNSKPSQGNSIVSYLWEFGDADNSTSTEQNPTFTYKKDGTFTVTLTVIDNNGLKATYKRDVVITNPTKPDFTLGADEYYLGDEVEFFDNTTTKGSTTVTSWYWEFADADMSTSTEQNPKFKYKEAGSYPVKLTVTDSYGLTATVTKSVNVYDPTKSIAVQWTATLGGAVKGGSSAAMSPDGSVVYMLRSLNGDDNAALVAYNAADGSQKWSFNISAGMAGGSESATAKDVFSSPAVGSDGTVYMIVRDLQSTTAQRAVYVLAVNPNGSLKWYYKGGVSGTNLYAVTPAIDAAGNIYVATRGSEIWKLTSAGNCTVFSNDVLGVTAGMSVSKSGVVYCASNGANGFFAFNTTSNSRLWLYNEDFGKAPDAFTGALRSAQASIATDGTVYFPTDLSTGGAVIAFNASGSTKWIHKTAGAIPDGGVAIASDGTLYVNGGTSTAEGLIAINSNGTRAWAFATAAAVQTCPIIDNRGYIHVVDAKANYYVVKPDGTLFAQQSLGDSTTSAPVMDAQGRLYIAVIKSDVPTMVCATSKASSYDTNAQWAMRGQNPCRTGLQK
jgi:PKD repeat protein